MKNPFLTLFIIFSALLILRCSKDDTNKDIDIEESLTEVEEQVLANFTGPSVIEDNSVILPNGLPLKDFIAMIDSNFYDNWFRSDPFESLSASDQKNLLIGRVSKIALYLTDRSKHQYSSDGANKPSQNGLAYGWGNKDYKVRRAGRNSYNSTCQEEVYGLDCSGFIYQVFKEAGVVLPHGAENQRRQIEQSIKSSIPSLKEIKVTDKGKIQTSEMLSGDIIYWTNSQGRARHIGIILKVNGETLVFQSNGYEAPPGQEDKCGLNLLPNRGPRSFTATFDKINQFGQNWSILRISSDPILISGEFYKTVGTCTPFCIISMEQDKLTLKGIDYSGSSDIVYQEVYTRRKEDPDIYDMTEPYAPGSLITVNSSKSFTFKSTVRTCDFSQ